MNKENLFACEHVCNLILSNSSDFGQLQGNEAVPINASIVQALQLLLHGDSLEPAIATTTREMAEFTGDG